MRAQGLKRMGDVPTFMVGDLQSDPSGVSRQLMMSVLFDVAEHFTHGTPEATYSDGRHESRLDYVFANTSAMRAVRKFKVSQEQVVPKHKLLVVEIDLEMYTATHMVMVRQIKLGGTGPEQAEEGFWGDLRGRETALC